MNTQTSFDLDQPVKLTHDLTIETFLKFDEATKEFNVRGHSFALHDLKNTKEEHLSLVDDIDAIIEAMDYYCAFLERALQIKDVYGFKVYGGRAIAEHLRWHTHHQDGSRLYKVQNNLTPRIVALAMVMFPELDGFFRRHGG